MNHLQSIVLAALSVALPVLSWSVEADTATTPSVGLGGTQAGTVPDAQSARDQPFLTTSALDDLFQVKSAQAALSLGQPKLVRDFATLMIDDHQGDLKRLQVLASAGGYTLPTDLDQARQHDLDALEKFQGDDFISVYAKHERTCADQAVALLLDEIAHGRDPSVTAYAHQRLPAIRHDRDMVDALPGQTENGNGSGNVPQAH